MTNVPPSSDWRDPILAHFTREIATVARLTIVVDPDRLLTEETILDGIRERGYDLIPFEDHVAFRYAYETRYRRAWDQGEQTNLVVLLHTLRADASALPFDLLQGAQRDRRLLRFSRAELFPKLSPAVLDGLETRSFDALHRALASHEPQQPLGDDRTKEFLVREVFEIVPEQIRDSADLLRLLLRRHYRGQQLPRILDDWLIAQLQKTKKFTSWPLERLVSNRQDFFAFLQERWPLFVITPKTMGAGVAEPIEPFGLRIPGPAELPFDDKDVRVYIDSLFLDGLLAPTDVLPKADVEGWIAVGVRGDEVEDAHLRFERLTNALEQSLPTEGDSYRAWTETAWRWAEWSALRWTLGARALKSNAGSSSALEKRVDETFTCWMLAHYASLHNVSYLPLPVMVHQVPRYLAHKWVPASRGGPATKRVALLVMDGLALSQWTLLRAPLTARKHRVSEHAIFAWVPTLTSVSRQSIFAGEPPFYFATSLSTTHKEEAHWRRFWEDRDASRAEVAYVCQKSQEPDAALIGRVKEAASQPRCRVLGVVVGMVDQMMHGAVTGAEGFHAQVRHWSETGAFQQLVETLLGLGYEVVITADHGNVEATGFGKPNVGAVADARGERVHVFADEVIRTKVQKEFPQTISWPQIALPDDYRALIASGRRAFVTEGARSVGHGGIALEELFVPFITVGSS